MDENAEAVEVWAEIQTQWRAGPAGIIGMDYAEARAAADEIGVEWGICLKRKIQALERTELSRVADQRKRDRESRKGA